MAKKEMSIASTTGVEVPALIISPNKAVAITGNFEQIEAYLVAVRDKYANVDLENANLEDVKRIKTEIRTYRTSIEKIEKTVKQDYFLNPKRVFEGNISRLYAIISEVENKADEVLDKEDQMRIDQINQAIDLYINEALTGAPLTESYLARIERKKAYYNKSQDELDTRNDINAQITALYREQRAESGNRKLIEKTCALDKRLSAAIFLDRLSNGEDIASVLELIDEERQRLNTLDNAVQAMAAPPPAVVQTEVTEDEYEAYLQERDGEIIEEVKAMDYTVDMPGRRKSVMVKIDYPMEASNLLTKVFGILHENGIHSEIV